MESKILTKEELKIIKLFEKDIFKNYTILEIIRKIGKKSYTWVFKAVKKLEKLGIIKIEKKGHSNICSINLNNNLSLVYLELIEQEKINEKLPLKNITKLMQLVPVSYFTFIITGSYVKGLETKKSDLDIVLITENKDDVKKVFVVLKNEGELMIPPVHLYAFSKEEFFKMLLDKEENYGKEIFRNHIIFFGVENYYLIVKEAIENGFKG